MNDWSKYKLGEVCDIIMGQSPKGNTYNYIGNGLPLLNGPTEFNEFHPIPKQCTIDPRKTANINDILFCVRGSTTGRMNFADQPYAIGRGIAAIRGKNNYTTKFIKYLIDYNLDQLLNITSGSTFPNLSKNDLFYFEALVPSSKVANTIASILSSLDDKIELNLEINKTLEEMVMAIYKEWFVNFGPFRDGEFVDSELGPIPKGWEVISLSDIVQINNKSYKPFNYPENEFFHYSIPAFDERNYPKIEFGKDIASNKTFINDKVILVSKLNPRIRRIWTVIPEDHYISFSSTEFINFQPRNIIDWGYINCYLRNELFYNEFLSHATGTTGSRQRVSPKETLNFKIILPQDQIRERFNDLSAPIFKLIVRNINENQDLIATRDYLLPKLTSGEIRVKEVEGKLKEVL